MALAELAGDRIVVAAEFREKELIKTVPGSKWDADAGNWWVPLSWAACQQLRGVFGTGLEVGPALSAWSRGERTNRVDPCLALRLAEDSPELEAVFTSLLPFQRAGVQFARTARHCLIADEMGLGKTVQAIATLEAIGDASYPALIVCPNSMKLTWAEEFRRWAPGREPVVISGTAVQKRKAIATIRDGIANVGIINYEALRTLTRLEGYGSVTMTEEEKKLKDLNDIPFKSVVADEAHKVNNPRAKQTRALWYMGRSADTRIALTGTPVANSPEDIWTLMRFVSPSEFPAKTKFIDRYAQQSFNVYGFMQTIGVKSETAAELFRILDPRFIRRTKEMVLPQLPPKQYATRYCEMVPKQRKAYDQMRETQLAQLEGGILMASNPLAQLTRLLQFSAALGEITADGSLIMTEPSCKIDALLEVINELGDQQALVFAESRQLIELAAARCLKEGIKVAQITGAVAPHDRALNARDFLDRKSKLLLLTLGAGAEGLSFPGISTEIFLQRSFSLTKNSQAEDRCHGIGRGVEGTATTVIDIITADSAEARVHASGVYKREMGEQITRDPEMVKAWLAK